MAAGFTIEKKKLNLLDDFIQKDYQNKTSNLKLLYKYDTEISSTALNLHFVSEINKLGPFGNENKTPTLWGQNRCRTLSREEKDHKHKD